MEILVYTIPFIIAVILAIVFPKKMVWWEYIAIILGSFLVSLIISLCMKAGNIQDTEYLGDYVTKVRHYDPWDEWIERRCTRQVRVGTDNDGNAIYEEEEYDCSYRQYHPENWSYFDSHLNEHIYNFKEPAFDYIRNRFGTPGVFVDMHRHYYTLDGDAQDYFWNGQVLTAQTLTREHTYTNRIRNSHSVFKYENIMPRKADSLGLFDYPRIRDVWHLDQNPVLVGENTFTPTKAEIDSVKYINGYFGERRQFRMFVLLFSQDADFEISEYQKSYWEGGNKNELVVCISATPERKVRWVNVFSWEDAPVMAVKTRDWVTAHCDSLSLSQLSEQVKNTLPEWKRKEFADFKYIKPRLKRWQETALLFVSFLLALGLGIFCVQNEHENR